MMADLKPDAVLSERWTIKSAVVSVLLFVRQQKAVENDVDIGIVPSHGLVPPTLGFSDLQNSLTFETKPNYFGTSPASRLNRPKDSTSANREVDSQVGSNVVKINFNAEIQGNICFFNRLNLLQSLQVISAVPTTSQEVADCNRTLTAQALSQVIIG